ncbi:hypothetical protein CCACVL1_16831 [Corchorus capsularis]|uniref:Uncharacterized protein n=1 Tax=Corchorus capsularis TaxID=210143 RepID=A0A1R3HVE0_COCAP|nr:hypothetical protein CCACVL1_16831 [Corchorus capsularis]
MGYLLRLPLELTSMILTKLGGNKLKSKAISPNLTACHANYGRPDLLVYCCPPGFEIPQPFVEFQFPDPPPKHVRTPTYHNVSSDDTWGVQD